MSLIEIAVVLLIQGAHAESPPYEAVMPIGSLPKDSTISIKSVDTGTSYIDPSVQQNGGTNFQKVNNDTLYQVESIQTGDTSSDSADLQSLSSRKQLVVKTLDLTEQQSCTPGSGVTTCTLSSNLPVYKTGGFDFINWFLNLFGLGYNQAPTIKAPLTRAVEQTPETAMASAVEKKVTEANSVLGQKKSTMPSCVDNLPADKQKDSKFTCGFLQAQKAFNKAKAEGKVTQDVFIFNDFSGGGVMGKMWFFNSDGTLANLTDKNPIWVSRGEGGFGQGTGSLKTPNGAVVTRAFRPPRQGNITDGIELDGLESDNQDIHDRGVLLHGWDPYTPTQGCLGIAGTLTTNRRGGRPDSLGGDPPYLDQLKKGFLKNGGVMIYNFTPKRADDCSSSAISTL